MVLRETGLIGTLLLFLFVSIDGATIATKVNTTAEERRAVVPLVVSIPSKVFRANKLNTNDVFERPIVFEPIQETELPTKELLDTQHLNAFPTRTVPKATTVEPTTTTSTTEATTSSTEPPVSTTTSTETPFVVEIDVQTEVAEVSSSASSSTTEEPTTSSSSLSTEAEQTESTSEAATNVTTTRSSNLDEVVEKDYGLSLGVNNEQSGRNGNGNGNGDGQLEIDDTELSHNVDETNPEPEDSETNVPSEVSESETPSEVDSNNEGVVEADVMDEAAQESELDYAVVAPSFEHGRREEARDLSAFHGPIADFAEHRSLDLAVEDQKDTITDTETSTEREPIDKSSSETNNDDVRTSMLYSVSVEHPLSGFDGESTPFVAVSTMKSGHRKKVMDENTTFLDKKAETSEKPTTDSIVVVMDAKQLGSMDDDDQFENSTLLVLDMSPEYNNTDSSSESESRASKNTFYRRRHQPWKTSGQVKDDSNSKDLIPEESVQEPVLFLEPKKPKVPSEDSAAAPSETVDVLDTDLVAGSQDDPEVIPDEGEYEYVYEYIDLNSTDIPENLPEGAVIVTEDQIGSGHPAVGQLKPFVTQPIDVVLANTSVATDVIDSSQPATFRTLNPPLSINTAELSLIQLNSTGNEGAAPAGILPVSEELPVTASSVEGTLPFIPGMPESPIYFVGIQREKIEPGIVAEERSPLSPVSPVAVKEVALEPLGPNSLQENKPQVVSSSKGNKEQLMSLYALSQALPMDHTSPFLNLINENGSSSVILPADLPDPFSEEFLGDKESNISISAAEEISTPELEPVTIKVTTAVPSTEAVTLPTEPVTVPATSEESKPTEKVPARGARPRGSRRSTTVASTTVEEASTAESPVTESARRTRPTRIGGRRRSSTAATTVEPASTPIPSANDDKTTTTEKTRFGGRGRGRFSANRGSRSNSSAGSDLETEVNGQKEPDKESNTIAPNGAKRVFTGRRTTAQPNDVKNVTAKEEKLTRATSRPARGRRPTTARVATKATEEKVTPAPSENGDEAEEGATRKAALFRPRGRGRFGPKSKSTTNEAETGVSTEQSVPVTEEVEQKESAQEGTAVPEGDSVDGTTTVVDDEGAAEEGTETTTEASGPPRKFPPRFRPGSRATIPHRTTESSA